jgi:hypothetical protein
MTVPKAIDRKIAISGFDLIPCKKNSIIGMP